MLEERLSKAYSQHSIGSYNLPNPGQQPSPYPSVESTAARSATSAENFYTGELDPSRTPVGHQYLQHVQQGPQPQFTGYDKRASMSMPPSSQYPHQAGQRSESWQKQPGPSAPVQYPSQTNYTPNDPPPTLQSDHLPHPSPQTPLNRTTEPAGTSAADPNATYYYNSPKLSNDHVTPSIPPETAPSPYPNLQHTLNYNGQSIPPTPASVPAQPPQQYQASSQQTQQPYWQQHQQHQQPQHPPQQRADQGPQAYQAGGTGYSGYAQESFPVAPRHAPQQPVVEESLIDL